MTDGLQHHKIVVPVVCLIFLARVQIVIILGPCIVNLKKCDVDMKTFSNLN